MENSNVINQAEEKSMPFSYTAKYVKLYGIFHVISAVSVAFLVVGIIYFALRMQMTSLDAVLNGIDLDITIVLAVLVAILGIVGAIGQFFTKRKLAVVNVALSKVWSSTKRKMIASGANAVASALLDGVAEDVANTANSIYQTIQAYKIRKYSIQGINYELARAGVPNAEKRGKLAFISMVASTILGLLSVIIGLVVIILNTVNSTNTEDTSFVSYGMYVFSLVFVFIVLDLSILSHYLLTSAKELQERA